LLTQSRQARANFISNVSTRGKVISKSRSPIDLYKTSLTLSLKNDINNNKSIKRSASERLKGEKNRYGIELIKEDYGLSNMSNNRVESKNACNNNKAS